MGYEELVASLRKVSVDEVVAVARDSFRSGEVSLVTLGQTKEEDLDLGCLEFTR
jgi:hypothetical protein